MMSFTLGSKAVRISVEGVVALIGFYVTYVRCDLPRVKLHGAGDTSTDPAGQYCHRIWNTAFKAARRDHVRLDMVYSHRDIRPEMSHMVAELTSGQEYLTVEFLDNEDMYLNNSEVQVFPVAAR